jgi:hypothetical protein
LLTTGTAKNDVQSFAPTAPLSLAAGRAKTSRREEAMLRFIAVAFALALASSAQAVPIAPIQQPHSVVTTVREACGAGMHMVNGVCVRTHARRAASRCVRGKTC